MSEESPRYLAYMLRVWQAGRSGSLAWRASLESPHTGERHTFTSLESLCAFLHERIGQNLPQPDTEAAAAPPGARDGLEPPSGGNLTWPAPGPAQPPSTSTGDGAISDA